MHIPPALYGPCTALLFVGLLFPATGSRAAADERLATPPEVACETGPARRMFGGTRWYVWSCADEASLAITAAKGNPAYPYYFRLWPTDDGYRIYGEGTGDARTGRRAGQDIRRLSPDQIIRLLIATRGG